MKLLSRVNPSNSWVIISMNYVVILYNRYTLSRVKESLCRNLSMNSMILSEIREKSRMKLEMLWYLVWNGMDRPKADKMLSRKNYMLYICTYFCGKLWFCVEELLESVEI